MPSETNLPKIVSAKNQPGTIQAQISIRAHDLRCDEEPLYGGNDAAPDPYDYVLAGVGGCTVVSLRQYAEKKGWEIGKIEMTLTYDYVGGEDIVTKEIAFTGELTAEQRQVLLRVAHCGTEKMLEGGMKFINRIVETTTNFP